MSDTTSANLSASVLLGDSAAIRDLRVEVETAARAQAKVLVLGETGAGKEVVSRLLHALGARQHRPFVAMNCSGVPETLLESELFGHMRGSFTGAFRDKPGLARVADGGSLFLDEVGEMSLRMQAVVLRFVETGEVQPVGAVTRDRVDVRLIAATNRDLRVQIAQREFREDLFYRLNVIQIRVPSLRERPGDIDLLLRHYLTVCSQKHGVAPPELTPGATALLLAYGWPGNVRELKNVAERLVVRQGGKPARERDLPEEILLAAAATPSPSSEGQPPLPTLASPTIEDAWNRMTDGESFWTAVHASFKSHDMTRADLRTLIRRGLKETKGSYRQLAELFHMESSDYRRFLSFLYQHDCHLPFQPYRDAVPVRTPGEVDAKRSDIPA